MIGGRLHIVIVILDPLMVLKAIESNMPFNFTVQSHS